MDADTLATWTDIVRNTSLTVAVLVGSLWALYVFVLGRKTTANVQIDYTLKDVVDLVDGEKVAVVAMKLKNTGRTQVYKVIETGRTQNFRKGDGCTATITPIVALAPPGIEPYQIPLSSIDERNRQYTRKGSFLENLDNLQPGEEAVEDFMFAWSDSLRFTSKTPAFKIEVRFVGREAITLGGWRLYSREQRIWASRGLMRVASGENA